ncbi:MAG: hypothetical protein IT335_14545 [Thermomicrobiales bacterium]|nr:hypothetical protein [Thermomicrobiales bacterium]
MFSNSDLRLGMTLRSLHREIVDAMRDRSIDGIEDDMRAVMEAASELRSAAGRFARVDTLK